MYDTPAKVWPGPRQKCHRRPRRARPYRAAHAAASVRTSRPQHCRDTLHRDVRLRHAFGATLDHPVRIALACAAIYLALAASYLPRLLATRPLPPAARLRAAASARHHRSAHPAVVCAHTPAARPPGRLAHAALPCSETVTSPHARARRTLTSCASSLASSLASSRLRSWPQPQRTRSPRSLSWKLACCTSRCICAAALKMKAAV